MNLFPPQKDVINMGFVTDTCHYFINMATGTGKTYIAELAILETLKKGFKAIYITPLRALAQQQQTRWNKIFKDYNIGVFTGDSLNKITKKNNYNSSHIMIMTPERFDACTRNWRTHWSWIPDVNIIIIDEFHIMNQGYRGSRLEGAITRMIRLNPFFRFVCLSATMPNSNYLANWLCGKSYESRWRQVNINSLIERFSDAKDKPLITLTHIKDCISKNGQSIVFCNSRSRVQNLANFLNNHGIPTTIHHAGLTHEIRQQNEIGYISGNYKVLVATSTVEMGLNFPTKQVIIYDSYSYSESGFTQIPVWSYIQRIGRAGRPGLDSSGESVLLLPKWAGDSKKYINEECEEISSSLCNEYALAEQILIDVCSGFSRTREELSNNFIPLTLYYHEHNDININGLINRLVLHDLLIEKDNPYSNSLTNRRLEVSILGRMTVKLMFSPETVTLIYKYKKLFPRVYLFDLLLIATMNTDCNPILHASFEELDSICEAVQNLPSSILDSKLESLQKKIQETPHASHILNAIKMSLVCYEITQGKPFDQISNTYDVYESDLRLLQESVVRLLSGMSAISSACDKKELGEEAAKKEAAKQESFTSLSNLLSTMLKYGINCELVTLTQIEGVGGKIARTLGENGFPNIHSLQNTTMIQLTSLPGIGEKLAKTIISQSKTLILKNNEYSEHKVASVNMLKSIKSNIDPYRLRRSLELSVKGKDGGRFCITGGREDHIVKICNGLFICDCLDYSNNLSDCKHILCAKRIMNDKEILGMAKRLKENRTHSLRESLPSLWYSLESIERR